MKWLVDKIGGFCITKKEGDTSEYYKGKEYYHIARGLNFLPSF